MLYHHLIATEYSQTPQIVPVRLAKPHEISRPVESWCWIIFDDLLDLSLVLRLIFLKNVVGFRLSGRVWIRIIQQILNTNDNLFDGDSRFPTLFFVENRQTDCAGWVDIGMEEWW